MIKEKIVKLNDEDLAEVSGGWKFNFAEWEKGFFGEMGKSCFLIVASPFIACVQEIGKWVGKKITDKAEASEKVESK